MLRGLSLPEDQNGSDRQATAEQRRARARAGLGTAAHLPGSVERFFRDKHEDVEREEERYRQRHPDEE